MCYEPFSKMLRRDPDISTPAVPTIPLIRLAPRHHAWFHALVVVLVTVSMIAGCARHFDGRVFRNDELAFELARVPRAWRLLDADGVLLAFRDDARHVTVMVNGRCGRDGDDVPLEALTKHLFLYFTERHVLSQVRMTLDGREALRTVESAKLDGVPRRFVSVVLKKDGCVYDFVHISGPKKDLLSEKRFDRFVRGFRTVDR